MRPPLVGSAAADITRCAVRKLEVLQRIVLDRQEFVMFSAHVATLTACRTQGGGGKSGTWIAPADRDIRINVAVNPIGPGLYSGRVVDLDGVEVLLAFRRIHDSGEFAGGVIDAILSPHQEDIPAARRPWKPHSIRRSMMVKRARWSGRNVRCRTRRSGPPAQRSFRLRGGGDPTLRRAGG